MAQPTGPAPLVGGHHKRTQVGVARRCRTGRVDRQRRGQVDAGPATQLIEQDRPHGCAAKEAHTPCPTAFEGVRGMNKSASAQGLDDPILQWVTFKLDNESYGINVMRVQEVLRYTEIAPVPGAPSYVLGIINLRGNVVTVIDTRQRFGLIPTEVNDNTRIVIIEADKQVVGIMVDSVAEAVYLRQSEVETAPNVGNEESAKFIQGVCNKNGELLILVELDKMMSEEEWSELESI